MKVDIVSKHNITGSELNITNECNNKDYIVSRHKTIDKPFVFVPENGLKTIAIQYASVKLRIYTDTEIDEKTFATCILRVYPHEIRRRYAQTSHEITTWNLNVKSKLYIYCGYAHDKECNSCCIS